jgi:hypothetical protein
MLLIFKNDARSFAWRALRWSFSKIVDTPVNVHLIFALTVSIRQRLLFPALWFINTKSIIFTVISLRVLRAQYHVLEVDGGVGAVGIGVLVLLLHHSALQVRCLSVAHHAQSYQ